MLKIGLAGIIVQVITVSGFNFEVVDFKSGAGGKTVIRFSEGAFVYQSPLGAVRRGVGVSMVFIDKNRQPGSGKSIQRQPVQQRNTVFQEQGKIEVCILLIKTAVTD